MPYLVDRLRRCKALQHELVPLLEADLGARLTPKLEQLLRLWEMIRIEDFVPVRRGLLGRPALERIAFARTFLAKAVLGLTTTAALIERLQVDGPRPPSQLIGHIARDWVASGHATEIQAREKPVVKPTPAAAATRKRGRPAHGEVREPLTRIARQIKGMSLDAMRADLPSLCDVACKTNSKGNKETWIGYKLRLDVADRVASGHGQIPISAMARGHPVLTSASVHDSQVAIPLATLTASRVVNPYDVMDAAYCSPMIRQHSRDLGHVPLTGWPLAMARGHPVDHNPRSGEIVTSRRTKQNATRSARKSNVSMLASRTNSVPATCACAVLLKLLPI